MIAGDAGPAAVERAAKVATKRIHQFECEWHEECAGPNFNQQRLGRFVAEALAAANLLAAPVPTGTTHEEKKDECTCGEDYDPKDPLTFHLCPVHGF